MNETSATASQSGASLLPDGIGAITAVHMVFMVLVAIAAIAIIVAGIRRKRIRTQAERQVRTNAREAGMTPPASEQQPTEEPRPVIEAPMPPVPTPAPAPPPPIAAAPVAATPQEPVAPPPPPAEPVSDPIPEPAPLADEPIAAAAPFDATPASVAADTPPAPDPVPAPAPALAPVDAANPANTPVTQLKGLGPKLATRLAGHGITTVGDLAALSDEQAQTLDAQLGPFTGRMSRDRWLEQARLLATGDRAGFEAVFGRL